MSEPPGKVPLPSGFSDDRASNSLARTELITSIEEPSQLKEAQAPVDALMERLRRLDTAELEGLIRALRGILAQAITASTERPEAESLALSSQSARSALAIRTSERPKLSLPQTAAQPPSIPNKLLRGRASSLRIANLFFISISIAVGATIGIFTFMAQNSSSLPKSSASRFDATTRSPNYIAPEYAPPATQTGFAEAPSSKVIASEGDFQIETQKEGSVLATRAPVWPSVTDELNGIDKSSARSATSTHEDALSSRTSGLAAQPLISAGVADEDSAQQKKSASGTLAHEGVDVSETHMLSQTMYAKRNSNDAQHTDQDHLETAEATNIPLSGSSDPFAKGAVALDTRADKVERAPQIGAGSPNSAELQLLLERADRSLEFGDISAARLFYERAAEVGSGAGAAGVGKTYDPLFLTQLGARGLRGDAVLASWWYQKASNAGDQEAAMRLNALTAKLNQ
jgi:hypothetical protein